MGVDKVLEPYIEDNPRILELNEEQQHRLSYLNFPAEGDFVAAFAFGKTIEVHAIV